VSRIAYLGGLGESSPTLSPHLRGRHEVGEILRSSGLPVIEFRASVVIGSGSLSFEMIRAMVDRLPVMIAPRRGSVPAHPVAIRGLLWYLLAALELPCVESRALEIAGADQVSHGGLMQEYAHQRGLKRFVLPVPVLTPRLSSLWLGLVTPLYVRGGRRLIASIRHPAAVRDRSALTEFRVPPVGYREAIAAALRTHDEVEDWEDTSAASGARFAYSLRINVNASPERFFAPIRGIGGSTGRHYAHWLWRLHGVVDIWMGGARAESRPSASRPT
jgi:hypothetical protein